MTPQDKKYIYEQKEKNEKMDKHEEYKSPYVIVDGEQVFTAKFEFEQMMSQSCRIDRAGNIAKVALVMGVLALTALGYVVATLLR